MYNIQKSETRICLDLVRYTHSIHLFLDGLCGRKATLNLKKKREKSHRKARMSVRARTWCCRTSRSWMDCLVASSSSQQFSLWTHVFVTALGLVTSTALDLSITLGLVIRIAFGLSIAFALVLSIALGLSIAFALVLKYCTWSKYCTCSDLKYCTWSKYCTCSS